MRRRPAFYRTFTERYPATPGGTTRPPALRGLESVQARATGRLAAIALRVTPSLPTPAEADENHRYQPLPVPPQAAHTAVDEEYLVGSKRPAIGPSARSSRPMRYRTRTADTSHSPAPG